MAKSSHKTDRAVVRTSDKSGTEIEAIAPALRAYLGDAQMPAVAAFATREELELWSIAVQCLAVEIKAKIAAGLALRQLRSELPPQGFSQGLRERGIARSTAYDAIDCAEVFEQFPNLEVVRLAGQLGFAKALTLKRLPLDERVALVSGEPVRGVTIHDAIGMTTREFTDAIRDPDLVKAEKKIAALQADKEGAEAEIKELKGALKHRYESLKMPDFAAHVRQESVALAEQMSLAVVAFEHLILERLGTDKEARTFPEWKDRACGTAYHALRSVHARTQALLEKIEETYGTDVTGKIDYEHTLSEGELAIARDALGVILKRHKAEADNREADRVNAKGGRGRPRGKKRVD